jgi:hypothetical protein
MIRVPLDPYRSRRPDGRTIDFTVETDDEGSIAVSIDVDPRELRTRHRGRNTDEAARVDLLLGQYPADAAVTSGTTEADVLALADEVRALREELESLVDSIDLHPEPGEARAMAAALIHHADEHERVFGRRF